MIVKESFYQPFANLLPTCETVPCRHDVGKQNHKPSSIRALGHVARFQTTFILTYSYIHRIQKSLVNTGLKRFPCTQDYTEIQILTLLFVGKCRQNFHIADIVHIYQNLHYCFVFNTLSH